MIVVDGISKFYGARRALTDISVEIGAGQVVGFLGLNGAGKTTLLKILSGLLLPSSGTFRVGDVDGLKNPRALRRKIGFLPDRPPLYDDLSVRQMLTYAGRLNEVSARDIGAKVDRAVSLCGLDEVKDDLVAWLSHGYRQRVGIAQAIVHEPDLVILDEPISGLDPVQIVAMRDLIEGLSADHTILLSSHVLGEISQTCDHLLVLNRGVLVAQGPESKLRDEMRSTRFTFLVRGAASDAEVALASVDDIDVLETASVDDETCRIELDAPSSDGTERAVKALVGAGLGVRRVAEAETGLENIFLKLTGQDAVAETREAA